jgi:hypothetical protein
MTADAFHIARKDLRQHRLWIAAYLAVVVLRAVLIGSGVDAAVRGRSVLVSLGMAYVVLCVLHLALVVTVAVQLVQGDRLVGTTAFWLTRPVSRGALLASKLGVAIAVLVVAPVLLDGLVVAGCRLAWLDVLGAVAEGMSLRLAVVLPIMTLAAVTADLAVFVVAAIAAMFGALAFQVTLQWLKLVAWKGNDLEESLVVVIVVVLACVSLTAFAHQIFTRRTRRTALIVIVGIGLTLSAASRLEQPFLPVPRALEAGWLDPARVSVGLTMEPARELPGRGDAPPAWQLMARFTMAGSTPNVVLTPFGSRAAVTLSGGTVERSEQVHQAGWGVVGLGSRLPGKDLVERLLGDVRLIDAQEAAGIAPVRAIAKLAPGSYRTYAERGGRLDVDVTVGALAYEACPALPLEPGLRSRCGDRQIRMLSAEYRDGKCLVELRDALAGFAVDLRRRSSVAYILVNRSARQALAMGARNYASSYPVFGRATFLLLAEHVVVTRRDLEFEFPKDAPGQLGPDWLKEAVIVPLHIRDIGQFTVKAQVGQDAGAR